MWQYFDIATQIRAFEKCSFIKPPTSNNIPKVAILHIKLIFVQPQIGTATKTSPNLILSLGLTVILALSSQPTLQYTNNAV